MFCSSVCVYIYTMLVMILVLLSEIKGRILILLHWKFWGEYILKNQNILDFWMGKKSTFVQRNT